MEFWAYAYPILKVFLYAATFVAVGSFLFCEHFRTYLRRPQILYCTALKRQSALLGIIISVSLFMAVAGNLGGDFVSALEFDMLRLVLESKSGISHLLSVIGFLLVSAALHRNSHANFAISLIGTIILLISFTVYGHSSQSGLLAQTFLLMHLLGITFWLGSLLPFHWMCSGGDPSNLHIIARQFGMLAIVYVGMLIFAGVAFAYLLLGEISQLYSTDYGQVLLGKIFLVSTLLSLAANNKFRLAPLLEKDLIRGKKKLCFSIRFEIIIAGFILFSSSLLTTSFQLPNNV